MLKTTKSSTSIIKVILKKDLKEELSKFPTKDDQKREIAKLATRKDLEITEKSLQIEMKLALLGLERRLEGKISQTRDILLTTFDPLLKELEQRQQDRELASDQTARLRSQIDDHEGRIKTLEQIQP